MKSVDVDTQNALANAARDGLVVRHLLHIEGKNRSTGVIEEINIWTGELALDLPYINPKTLGTNSRVYQPGAGWLQVPSIPQKIELEARSVRLTFSRLPAAAINIIRTYDPKLQTVEIHRALFNPSTRNLIAPAYCLLSGFCNRAPIKVPAVGGEGDVEMEVSSNSRFLTRPKGDKFSDEFMKRRTDRFGRYLDVAGIWRVFWGEKEHTSGKGKSSKRERFDK